jgi:hypothetical protein
MISAVASRFSGGFSGCLLLVDWIRDYQRVAYRLSEQEVVVFGFHPQVLKYRIRPEAFHEILESISTRYTQSATSHTQFST